MIRPGPFVALKMKGGYDWPLVTEWHSDRQCLLFNLKAIKV